MTPQELILSHLHTARKIAAKYGARRNDSDRDELLSAAYFGLVRAAKKTDPNNSYVAKCIRGEVKKAISRLNQHKAFHLSDTVYEETFRLDGKLIAACLAFLPRKLHRIFLLYHRDGLTQTEVADKTGNSRKSVQGQLAVAMNLLLLHKDEIADSIF